MAQKKPLKMVVSEEGFEPPTPWFVATCSNPLSYRPRPHWIRLRWRLVSPRFPLICQYSFLTEKRVRGCAIWDGVPDRDEPYDKKMKGISSLFFFILASSYFSAGPPLQYCYRSRVSPPSSRWIGVVPLRLGHQNINLWKGIRIE